MSKFLLYEMQKKRKMYKKGEKIKKKVIFFIKSLRMSKKCSTFARFFV